MKAKQEVDDFGKQPISQSTDEGIVKAPRLPQIPGHYDHIVALFHFFDQGGDFLWYRVAVRTERDNDVTFNVRVILDQTEADAAFFLQVYSYPISRAYSIVPSVEPPSTIMIWWISSRFTRGMITRMPLISLRVGTTNVTFNFKFAFSLFIYDHYQITTN